MIPLEQQVTTLAISKRLKELGVKQESLFYSDKHGDRALYRYTYEQIMPVYISAFTVAEIGEILPENIRANRGNKKKSIRGVDFEFYQQGKHSIGYSHREYDSEEDLFDPIEITTEADARGKMLIYLLENNFIKP